jgi:hypothetical protein
LGLAAVQENLSAEGFHRFTVLHEFQEFVVVRVWIFPNGFETSRGLEVRADRENGTCLQICEGFIQIYLLRKLFYISLQFHTPIEEQFCGFHILGIPHDGRLLGPNRKRVIVGREGEAANASILGLGQGASKCGHCGHCRAIRNHLGGRKSAPHKDWLLLIHQLVVPFPTVFVNYLQKYFAQEYCDFMSK